MFSPLAIRALNLPPDRFDRKKLPIIDDTTFYSPSDAEKNRKHMEWR
jgi:hypothetical protein